MYFIRSRPFLDVITKIVVVYFIKVVIHIIIIIIYYYYYPSKILLLVIHAGEAWLSNNGMGRGV